MCDTRITIRRAYVTECERFWQEAPVKWTHNNVNNAKTLISVQDAKNYIFTASNIWDINNTRSGQMFIKTLYANCEQVGAAAAEHTSAQYQPGTQDGTCKYILVVIYNNNGRVTVSYSYHDITETLRGSNFSYTQYAEAITIDWLKSKAVESIRGTLPRQCLPQITYE